MQEKPHEGRPHHRRSPPRHHPQRTEAADDQNTLVAILPNRQIGRDGRPRASSRPLQSMNWPNVPIAGLKDISPRRTCRPERRSTASPSMPCPWSPRPRSSRSPLVTADSSQRAPCGYSRSFVHIRCRGVRACARSVPLKLANRVEGGRNTTYCEAEDKTEAGTGRRPDPFAEVTHELRGWFEEGPWQTSRELLARLQSEYPEKYPSLLLRTLQRRVKVWRKEKAHEMVFGTTWSAAAFKTMTE